MSEPSETTDREVIEEILEHVRSLNASRYSEEESEHVLCIAETTHFLLGTTIAALSKAGASVEEISAFVEPLEARLRVHLAALGLDPGDSMNITEPDGRRAVEAFPKTLGCARCKTFVLECECE